jgi:hypothetical protein
MTTRKVRAARSSAVLMATALVSTIFAGSPAQAATNPYTPTGLCGSGYSVVDSEPLNSLATGGVLATVYVLHKSGGWECVVTLKSSATAGGTNWIKASVENDYTWKKYTNSGNFKYYAGPVKVETSGAYECANWGGEYTNGDYTLGYYDKYC